MSSVHQYLVRVETAKQGGLPNDGKKEKSVLNLFFHNAPARKES